MRECAQNVFHANFQNLNNLRRLLVRFRYRVTKGMILPNADGKASPVNLGAFEGALTAKRGAKVLEFSLPDVA